MAAIYDGAEAQRAASLLALLRCPCCMSRLTRDEDGSRLRCACCACHYPLRQTSAGALLVERLKRDDALATLAQDLVVNRDDPDSAPLEQRALVSRAEQREQFLAGLRRHAVRSRTPPSAPPDMPWPSPLETTLYERFTGLLPTGADVLDLACGEGNWTARLAAAGLRVIAMDGAPYPARAAAMAQGSEAILYVEANMMEVPFAAASLHGVWCSGAFTLVRPDRRTVFFRQVNRVLRPGGLLYLRVETEPLAAMTRRYLLWRLVLRRPVAFGECIDRIEGNGWSYRAVASTRTLRALCRDHGFGRVSLRRDDSSLLLLARKTRGTHG